MTPAALGRLVPAALMTLAAGLLLGFVLGQRTVDAPDPLLASDLAAYEEGMVRTLELGPNQRKDLRLLLLYYEKERNRLLERQRLELEPQLATNDQRFYELIKTRVLKPEQRRRARELLRPALVSEAGLPAADGDSRLSSGEPRG